MARAAEKSGRDPAGILLVSVSKTRSAEEILHAVQAGAVHMGENKVQEIQAKEPLLADMVKKEGISTEINWHMIGHLQRNKVKYIIDKVRLIHSVESLKLAEEIDVRAAATGRIAEILVQINAAGEETKSGVAPQEAKDLVREILEAFSHIRVRGLMTIAPAAEDPEEVRGDFRRIKGIFDEIASSLTHERLSCDTLSMGMTGDFEVAIEEGSNLVRVGTGIFGERNYNRVSEV